MIRLTNPDDAALKETVQQLLSGVKSIAAVARTIGKSRGTLYKWQSGASIPTIAELCTLANTLGIIIVITMGPGESIETTEDLAVMIGRVLANQERQIAMIANLVSVVTGNGPGQ